MPDEIKKICAQFGPQTAFHQSPADIAVFGGAAGPGKTFSLLYEGTRNILNPGYGAVIFRKTYPEINDEGGLWDESMKIYPYLHGIPRRSDLAWIFPSGAAISFSHLQYQKLEEMRGQYAYIGIDEVTEFSEREVFFLFGRNRSTCGIKPYMRMTCNPDPEHFLVKGKDGWGTGLISWWIDPDTGLPILKRSGVMRYFCREGDRIVWVPKEWRDVDGLPPTSITFIHADVDDNKILMEADPSYKSKLRSLDRVTKERFLDGNWKSSYSGGMFSADDFIIIDRDQVPADMVCCRYWDRACTEVTEQNPDPDYTAGAMGGAWCDNLYIIDMDVFRDTPAVNESRIRRDAEIDGKYVQIGLEQEPGSGGKETAIHYRDRVLKGFSVLLDKPGNRGRVKDDKIARAKPWCAKSQNKKVFLVRAPWNRDFLVQVSKFPLGTHKDMVDAVSGLYKMVSGIARPMFSAFNHEECVADFDINFSNLSDANTLLLCIWLEKDLRTSVIITDFNAETGKLYVFGEWEFDNPRPEIIIPTVTRDVRKYSTPEGEEKPKIDKVTNLDWFGNDEFFNASRGDVRDAYRQIGVTLRKNYQYDELGAATLANRLMFRKRDEKPKLRILNTLNLLPMQLQSWSIEEGKPYPGYGMARAFCLCISNLAETGKIQESEDGKLPAYSKAKMLQVQRNEQDTKNDTGEGQSDNTTDAHGWMGV